MNDFSSFEPPTFSGLACRNQNGWPNQTDHAVTEAKDKHPLLEDAIYVSAVSQISKRPVREIRTLRSEGVGATAFSLSQARLSHLYKQ